MALWIERRRCDHSLSLLRRGINFYDTSDLYGDGRSEVLLAAAFGKVREKVIIASKGGTLPHRGFHMPQNFSPAYLRGAVEKSLKRLGSDYIDLYQLHSPTAADFSAPEVFETLEQLRSEGKIREFGVSVRSPKDGLKAIELNYPAVQVNYNLIDQRCQDFGFFTAAIRHDTGVIIRTPLSFGYLSGGMTGEEKFDSLDHRLNWPKAQLKRWASAPTVFSELGAASDRTYVELALQFCLAPDAVSTVIPGMLSVSQVEEDVAAVEGPRLTAGDLAGIRKIYQANSFFDPNAKSISQRLKTPGV